jgi:hypothetical protein
MANHPARRTRGQNLPPRSSSGGMSAQHLAVDHHGVVKRVRTRSDSSEWYPDATHNARTRGNGRPICAAGYRRQYRVRGEHRGSGMVLG